MTNPTPPKRLFIDLRERNKELDCLYRVEELISTHFKSTDDLLQAIADTLPPGFLYADICQAKITFKGKEYRSKRFQRTPWRLSALIRMQEKEFGVVEICYQKRLGSMNENPFLKEEKRLLNTIGERLGHALFLMDYVQSSSETDDGEFSKEPRDLKKEWKIILDLLRQTDRKLFSRIARKMVNYLVWSGHKQAAEYIQRFSYRQQGQLQPDVEDLNQPSQKRNLATVIELGNEIFALAEKILTDAEILTCIQKWIQEEKASLIVQVLGSHDSTLSQIVDAISRYHFLAPDEGINLSSHTDMGLRVSLIRQFFFDQLSFINIAKNFIHIEDFYDLVQHIIFPTGSHGKLGGKSAGMFLAYNILKKSEHSRELFKNIKIPKTWYISSDGLPVFVKYNNLEEVTEQKYKEVDQVRIEYPQIIQLFKNSYFPPEIMRGLSMALDDIGEIPIIVRSSSLLEDRLGTAFSGKYKSLFLANQGTKKERLDALTDAIAEVYASTFGPDPIEYRKERGLLDFYEEMGIMIQQVVGHQAGQYFLPTYAGVAFSNNEFRWSPRIQREDGLIRLVPGLGTRAVDRTSDDYPILIAPGKPALKVNITPEDIARYAPRKIDVINMTTNLFETIDITEFIKEFGHDLPGITRVLSKYERHHLRPASGMTDFENDDLVVTFDSLRSKTNFVKQMKEMLTLLEEKMGNPVDIEFASDGKDFYLLQCRPQSFASGVKGAPIPKNIPADLSVFSARRYVTNGLIPPVSHIVYVDPQGYNSLETLEEMKAIGQAIGKLNKILPKRQFILMGPGRWGSRGDIKLGVSVTYSDFNNTSALIEIALKKGKYVPELSFGTHFFQDLVEANIRYLPLYPDDEGVVFNWEFLKESRNMLTDLLPEYEPLADTLRVIDVPGSTGGKILRILMNADEDHAVGYLSSDSDVVDIASDAEEFKMEPGENHWHWRMQMARKIALEMGRKGFSVKAAYIYGSTKNKTAGPESDINLVIHFTGDSLKRKALDNWLEGWSLCLAEMNYLRTGKKCLDGLLDVHIITDEDISSGDSYAKKINAATNSAIQLPVKT